MSLGLWRALAALGLCTAIGLTAAHRARARAQTLAAWQTVLQTLLLLLRQERMPMDELLALSSQSAAPCEVTKRLCETAALLRTQPSRTVADAYRTVERRYPAEGERPLERELIHQLFLLLGQGSAEQRAQAVRRTAQAVAELAQESRKKAKESGALYARLGVLGGLALGVAVL